MRIFYNHCQPNDRIELRVEEKLFVSITAYNVYCNIKFLQLYSAYECI